MLERQMGTTRPRFLPSDRVFLAALLHRLPREVLGQFRRPAEGCHRRSLIEAGGTVLAPHWLARSRHLQT